MGHMHGLQPRDRQAWGGSDPRPAFEPAPVLPEREWGLSARQTVAIVLAILAVCEVIGLLS